MGLAATQARVEGIARRFVKAAGIKAATKIGSEAAQLWQLSTPEGRRQAKQLLMDAARRRGLTLTDMDAALVAAWCVANC